MDATGFAGKLLESVPANATLGLVVVSAVDGRGEVECEVPEAFHNVIGSLHSSGLIGLVDAACLAAVISAAADDAELDGIVPLGSNATMRFRQPARGRLVATCVLTDEAQEGLDSIYGGEVDRVRVTTTADITDETGEVVCSGSFDWSVKRTKA
ncbi:MAG: PaaI family thioesterase [Marmoricola sp.]